MRSSWNDSSAVYVGMKMGSPSVNHGHMDLSLIHIYILKDGPVILNNQKCCGDFAIFAKRKGKNSVYVGNGSFVENKEFQVESENRGRF